MPYQLEIRVMMFDARQLWQAFCVNHINVSESEDIGTRGNQPMPGFSFLQEMVSELFSTWIGPNTYGEAIFQAINESNERHGCFFVDTNTMSREPHEKPQHNGDYRPVVVEWELARVSDAAVATEESISLEGSGSEESELIDENQYTLHKTYQRSNDRWKLTRKHPEEPDDVLALCQTERLVDMLIAMLSDPMIIISHRDGQVQDVMCPYNFLPSVNFLLVDWDTLEQDQDLIVSTSEDGEGLTAAVYQPDLCHPTGAGTVDRIVAAFLNQ
jgi:hypothetical protein